MPHQNPRRAQGGFTLIELIIVAAMVAILSAIALPAYQSYRDGAQMTKVDSHFNEAVRYAEHRMIDLQTQVAMGSLEVDDVNTNVTSASIIAEIDSRDSGTAPGGGPAYIVGASDPNTGAVGVLVDGDVPAMTITIERPAYGTFIAAETEVISW